MRNGFVQLFEDVAGCERCPRLVAWRTAVGEDPPARYRGQHYWSRGVPGFGDEDPWLLIVGLAPAAHGANRTGRPFTGDYAGELLYGTLMPGPHISRRLGDILR